MAQTMLTRSVGLASGIQGSMLHYIWLAVIVLAGIPHNVGGCHVARL